MYSVAPWSLVGQTASVSFTLLTEAEPGILPRLLQPFARRDLTIDNLESVRVGDKIQVKIKMKSIPAEMVHLIEGNLAQTVGVLSVVRRTEITGSVRRAA